MLVIETTLSSNVTVTGVAVSDSRPNARIGAPRQVGLLGVPLDSCLAMDSHVNETVRSYHLQALHCVTLVRRNNRIGLLVG